MRNLEGPTALLRRLLGRDEWLKLIEAFGGTRYMIPRDATNRGKVTKLAQLIGQDAAQRLCREYGGIYMRVPLERALRVKVYRGQGWSYARIARKLGITEGQVGKLLNDLGLTKAKGSKP